MITIPSKLKPEVKYVMQIVEASSQFKTRGIPMWRYSFRLRIWPDKNDLARFCDVREVFYSHGESANKLVAFIEGATSYEFDIDETDVEFTVGAVFKGYISARTKHGSYGPDKFYHVEVIKHCGYCNIEGGKTE